MLTNTIWLVIQSRNLSLLAILLFFFSLLPSIFALLLSTFFVINYAEVVVELVAAEEDDGCNVTGGYSTSHVIVLDVASHGKVLIITSCEK